MMVLEGWEVTALENVLTIKYGKDQKEVESIDGKYPILGTGGIIGYTNSFLCDQPSVLIGRKGTINSPMYMNTPFWTVDTLFYSHIKKNNDPKWVFYIFQSINWTKYNEASGVPSLSAGNINRVKIKRPIFSEQQKIATILSTLDRTIEATQKLIDKEKMVKKGLMADLLTHGIDEQGRIRSPQTHIYVNSPLGMFPEGWEVCDFGNLVSNKTKKANSLVMMPIIDLEHIEQDNGKLISNSWENDYPKDKVLFTNDDIVFGKLRPYLKKYWFCSFVGACTSELIVMQSKKGFIPKFVYYIVHNESFLAHANRYSYGTKMPRVSFDDLKSLLLAIPVNLIEQEKIVTILSAQDRKIETEEINLAKLRNLKKGLMGDLLSGDIRVKT